MAGSAMPCLLLYWPFLFGLLESSAQSRKGPLHYALLFSPERVNLTIHEAELKDKIGANWESQSCTPHDRVICTITKDRVAFRDMIANKQQN